MRIWTMRCPRCGWRTPRPVSERVVIAMGEHCKECEHKDNVRVKFEKTEKVVVGKATFLPHKEE